MTRAAGRSFPVLGLVTMLLMVLMTYPFLYSFLALRINQPDVPRAFKIPGGMPGTHTKYSKC